MVKIRRMRLAPYISALLLVAMYGMPAVGAAKPAQAPVKTIIVFPFDTSGEATAANLSNDLARSITTDITAFGGYRAFSYSKLLPSVQRAQQETTLKPAELDGPFGVEKDQIALARKIADETGADLFMVGVIDDAKVDAAKKTAEVTLTALIADVNTGETLKNAAVTGQVPPTSAATTESDLLAVAAGDAVSKLVKAVGVPDAAPVQAVPVTQEKKSHGKSLLVMLLLAAAVGIAVSGHSGGSGSSDGGNDSPPDVPVF